MGVKQSWSDLTSKGPITAGSAGLFAVLENLGKDSLQICASFSDDVWMEGSSVILVVTKRNIWSISLPVIAVNWGTGIHKSLNIQSEFDLERLSVLRAQVGTLEHILDRRRVILHHFRRWIFLTKR